MDEKLLLKLLLDTDMIAYSWASLSKPHYSVKALDDIEDRLVEFETIVGHSSQDYDLDSGVRLYKKVKDNYNLFATVRDDEITILEQQE